MHGSELLLCPHGLTLTYMHVNQLAQSRKIDVCTVP